MYIEAGAEADTKPV